MAKRSGKIKDPQIEAANEIYKTAREHADQEIAKLKGEMDAVREESRALGAIQKIKYDIAHNELLKYAVLAKVKEKKSYRQGGLTWVQFCEAIGESWRRVDEVLADIRPIVNQFSAESADFLGFQFNKIRYLGRMISADSAEIEDGALIIDDQRIPLTPENKDEIESAIDAMKEAHKEQAEEQAADVRAKDKVLKAKETVINKQEKEIARLEGRAKKAGYAPGEEAFIQKMYNAMITIDGWLMDFDPEKQPLPEDATPRMEAAMMETLGYFKRVIDATYDTAADLYGDPEIDDDWVPPHLRGPEDTTLDTPPASEL